MEKQTRVSSRPGTPVRSRSRKNLKIDKALAAFKVRELYVSGPKQSLSANYSLIRQQSKGCGKIVVGKNYYCDLFEALDSDNSGYLDREEFLNFASNLPVKNREKLLKSLDSDGDGRVDLEEFRALFNKK